MQNTIKQINLDEDFDKKIISGVEKLFQVVSKTFGPNGRTIVLKQKDKLPIVTKDGYTVAKFFDLEDPIESIGADFIRKAAEKTAKVAGDGTSSTSILSYFLLKAAFELKKQGIHPVEIAKNFDETLPIIKNLLINSSKEIETINDLKNVAMISTNGDSELADLVSKSIEAIGADGMVQIRETTNDKSYIEITDGFRVSGGLATSKLLPINEAILKIEDCAILIINESIKYSNDLLNVLKQCMSIPKKIIIIGHDFNDQILSTIIKLSTDKESINKFIPIQIPIFGKDRINLIDDLGVFVGGTVFGKENSLPISSFSFDDLGFCEKIECSRTKSLLVNGASKEGSIDLRISQLKSELQNNEDETELLKLNSRITNLSSLACYFYVGGNSELDRIERKHRTEDAISACASAVKSGILPGGGCALKYVADLLEQTQYINKFSQIWQDCLRQPYNILCENSNIDKKLYENLSKSETVDLKNNKKVNAFESGIIDVTMCISNAIENAVNVVKMLILSNGSITEITKENK